MNTNELDCVLIEGKDTDGLVLRFTLRGANPQELKDKVDKCKQLWFPTLIPNTTTYTGTAPVGQTVSVSAQPTGLQGALGVCNKCGAPNKISKQGKVYCGNTCWIQK